MQPLQTETLSTRSDVLHAKYMYGIWFGVAVGLAFSIFSWAIDAYRLGQMNGLFPWLKFAVGVIPCMLLGAFTGWLSARLDKPILAMVLWVAAASVFAWLAVNIPLQIAPRLVTLLEPGIENLLHYTYYEQFAFRFGVAYFWLAIFAALAGLMQIPLSDSAIFSTSIFARIAPMLVIAVLMAISGSTMDNLNNELLRAPVGAINATIQFFMDHQGEDIDPAVSRRMHLASLRTVRDLVTPERKLIISGYDETLGKVQVLAKFQDAWVECEVMYEQPLYCEQVGLGQ
ncbi:MAG TPA: hypothetical protein VK897_06220 [Anaerolineales bacterium]|nr:hypothetical protein [Anaerolineales bacterium]